MHILKIVILLVLVAAIAYIAITRGGEIKQAAFEFINPAIKEQHIITELSKNLTAMEKIISTAKESTDVKELQNKIVLGKKLLEESQSLVSDLSEFVDKKASASMASSPLPSCAPYQK